MKTLTICLCLSLIGCSASRSGQVLNLAVVGSAAADVVSTRVAIQRGGVEANPILGQGVWRQVIGKSLGVGAVIALSQVVEREHPRWAQVIRGIAIVSWSAASIHNVLR